jgi:hypothetical protein
MIFSHDACTCLAAMAPPAYVTACFVQALLNTPAFMFTVLLLIITGKEKDLRQFGDRLKKPNNKPAAFGDI